MIRQMFLDRLVSDTAGGSTSSTWTQAKIVKLCIEAGIQFDDGDFDEEELNNLVRRNTKKTNKMNPDSRCICGHLENMHYGGPGSSKCMKIITKHHSGNVKCTCQEFKPETQKEMMK